MLVFKLLTLCLICIILSTFVTTARQCPSTVSSRYLKCGNRRQETISWNCEVALNEDCPLYSRNKGKYQITCIPSVADKVNIKRKRVTLCTYTKSCGTKGYVYDCPRGTNEDNAEYSDYGDEIEHEIEEIYPPSGIK